MTPCPSPERLGRLLEEDAAATDGQLLMEHVGQCERCRETLRKLSVEMNDWQDWESMLRTQRDLWPGPNDETWDAPPVAQRLRGGQPGERTEDQATTQDQPGDAGSPAPSPTPATAEAAGRPFGDYELLEKLGAGGMGVVYRARHRRANRVVALKLIRPERLESLPPDERQAWLDRFRAEALAAARLEHDNMVTVYEVGEIDGTLYYSMQYVDGLSLADIVRDGPLENRRAARLIRSVARAVEHAHTHGILHRDLKPHNILVRSNSPGAGGTAPTTRSNSESPTSGSQAGDEERPFVVDFGVAKWMEAGLSGATHTGDVVGTPSYMSPEQVRDASRCTAASDIYGLGATLYELLTGRPPFRGVSSLETLRQVLDQDPVAPRNLNPSIDRDLETITLKCLAKEPARRYATAARMADDLQRYIHLEPIAARPVSSVERTLRWCRRNPVVAALAAGIMSLLLIVAVGSSVYSFRISHYAQGEHLARTEAEHYLRVTLEAIDQMLTTVGEESLEHVPQMEDVRKTLLQKALDSHLQLLAYQPTDAALQLDFARAQHRMGDIYVLLGEHSQAESAYSEAIRLCQRLRSESSQDLQVQHLLGISLTMLGEVYRKFSPQDASAKYQEALGIQEKLHALEADNEEYRLELSRTLNNFGLLLTDTAQYEGAEAKLRSAISHLETLTAQPQPTAEVMSDLGRSQINLGVLLRRQPQRAAEAEAAFQKAVDLLRRLATRDPGNRDYQYRLAVALLDLSHHLQRPGRVEDAVRSTREANSKLSKLCEDFPGIPLYRYELANSHNSLANGLAGSDRDGAKQQLHQAQTVLEELQARFPGYAQKVADFHSLRGIVCGGLGQVEFELQDEPDAQTAQRFIEDAIRHQRVAEELSPDNPTYVDRAGGHHLYLAKILDSRGLTRQAESHREQADALASKAKKMRAGEPAADAGISQR